MVDPEPDSTAAPWFGDAIRGQRLDWLVLCGVFLMGAYCASLALNGPIDDALILHQYVDRVLEGKGLTFNDGEYVEGYTSLLWTLLLSLGALSGLSIESTSLILSYGSLALMIFGVGRLFRILRMERAVQLPVLVLLVSNKGDILAAEGIGLVGYSRPRSTCTTRPA